MLIFIQPGQQAKAKYALLEADGQVNEVSPGVYDVSAASRDMLTAAGIAATVVKPAKKAQEAADADGN